MNTLKWGNKSFSELSNHDVYAIGHLRQEVFVVEQNCAYLDFDFKDQKCWHVMAWDKDEQLVAYSRLLPIGLKYPNSTAIGRVITSSKVRGKGVGKELMKKSIKYCLEVFGKHNIRISAQDYLLKFYSELGFVDTGKKYLEDNFPHSEMSFKILD
ncbi:GNAT family N-acetyltransferase [Aureispira]|nr:GNAT family N-acetyltransferase [Aureispira sp.]